MGCLIDLESNFSNFSDYMKKKTWSAMKMKIEKLRWTSAKPKK